MEIAACGQQGKRSIVDGPQAAMIVGDMKVGVGDHVAAAAQTFRLKSVLCCASGYTDGMITNAFGSHPGT